MTYLPDPDGEFHKAVADFLALLDAEYAAKPEVAAHTLRYIRIEAALGRWKAPRTASVC